MAKRQPALKETRTERTERESLQEIGSLVRPSLLASSSVLGYKLVAGSSSRYRVISTHGSFECSRAQLKQLLREDVAEEAI